MLRLCIVSVGMTSSDGKSENPWIQNFLRTLKGSKRQVLTSTELPEDQDLRGYQIATAHPERIWGHAPA